MRLPLRAYGETTRSAPARSSVETDSAREARATIVSFGLSARAAIVT